MVQSVEIDIVKERSRSNSKINFLVAKYAEKYLIMICFLGISAINTFFLQWVCQPGEDSHSISIIDESRVTMGEIREEKLTKK